MANWVIPDIHGCIKTVQYLIEKDIAPTKSDKLYFLGDFIDRGADSRGVIDYMMRLQNEGYNIEYLLGNHETYMIDAWETDQKRHLFKSAAEREWEKHGGKNTLKSFGTRRPKNIEKRYIDWVKKGKYFIALNDYVLVHAGMNFSIPDPFDDVMSMIWRRDFKVDRDKIDGRKLIHGHVPVELSLINLFLESDEYDFIALDNGVYYENKSGFGNLLALNIDTKKLIVQPNIDF